MNFLKSECIPVSFECTLQHIVKSSRNNMKEFAYMNIELDLELFSLSLWRNLFYGFSCNFAFFSLHIHCCSIPLACGCAAAMVVQCEAAIEYYVLFIVAQMFKEHNDKRTQLYVYCFTCIDSIEVWIKLKLFNV